MAMRRGPHDGSLVTRTARSFVAAVGEPNLAAAVANTEPTSVASFNAQWVGGAHPVL